MSKTSLETLVSLAKRRGFVYQGSEIYGGLAGTWDYGPLGVALKRNVENLWWKMFVENRADMYGIDSAVLMNAKVWEASGHVATFSDPLVECKKCHNRFRDDELKTESACPHCGAKNSFIDPRQFNLMFKTNIGPLEDEGSVTYLRPETAQGMFVNFKNVLDSVRPDLPFGLAQIGKAFRNEISPRDWLFRAREFEIMELEYFVHESDWKKHFEDWHKEFAKWFDVIGLPKDMVHEKEVSAGDRAHYSKRTIDFEFDFPFGKAELYGLAYRTDFDLKNHQHNSGVSMKYQPKDGSEPFFPHVIEPTFGLDRTILAILTAAYTEEGTGDDKRLYLKLAPAIAPVKVAVFPLLKNKPELTKKAKDVYDILKKEIGNVMWDDNGNIGKRYRRQDEIGTPYCVTIDFDSLKGNDVTIRERDSMKQSRVKISELTEILGRKLTD